ncbi:hypothetical protein SAMN05421819_1143 [Bryocella elongata]|uniref:SpoVT-AbrB domain-containing protein n=1 Tax=Bryocella elongata TaxID=863522 RepID=A0A1H5UQR4_9BACT|nr:hypothetical protein [Bryocella elongata]SEF77423.1 hypothetical protein SAMN05421819_1143 [Bryocella elongata]
MPRDWHGLSLCNAEQLTESILDFSSGRSQHFGLLGQGSHNGDPGQYFDGCQSHRCALLLASRHIYSMLAKKTVKNQITLPKTVVSRFGNVEYFDVSTDGETILLRPLRESRTDEVRERLAKLGVTEGDVAAAVRRARE